MGNKIVAGIILGDKCTELNVFYGHFFYPGSQAEYLVHLCRGKSGPLSEDQIFFYGIAEDAQLFYHSIICHGGCIRDI
ncbi:hypothetical protein DSECCO2_446710 [anaerobic digester metagenome]